MIQIDSVTVAEAMTQFERISLWLHFGTVVVAIVGLKLIVDQLKLNAQAVGLDHDRRKKQATVEILERTNPLWRKLRKQIEDGLNIKRLQQINKGYVETIKKNPQLQDWTAELLNSLERVATGVNCKVFDRNILFRSSGSYLKGLYTQFETYITELRKPPSTTYSEFTSLMEELDKRLATPPDRKAEVENLG